MDAHRDSRGVDDVGASNEMMVSHLLKFILVTDVSDRVIGLGLVLPRVLDLELVHSIVIEITAIRPNIVAYLQLMRVKLKYDLVLEVEIWVLIVVLMQRFQEIKLLQVVAQVHFLDAIFENVILACTVVIVVTGDVDLEVHWVEPLHLVFELSGTDEFLQGPDILLFSLFKKGRLPKLFKVVDAILVVFFVFLEALLGQLFELFFKDSVLVVPQVIEEVVNHDAIRNSSVIGSAVGSLVEAELLLQVILSGVDIDFVLESPGDVVVVPVLDA